MKLTDEIRARRRDLSRFERLPSRLRAVRKHFNVTQDRVAQELGVHPVTVARWETGARSPHPDGAELVRLVALVEELEALAKEFPLGGTTGGTLAR